jgi:hypothetical protein
MPCTQSGVSDYTATWEEGSSSRQVARGLARGAVVDSRRPKALHSYHSPDRSSGSGSARLDLSQKGDLPSSGEQIAYWSKVADARKARMGKGPGRREPGPPASFRGQRGGYIPKQDALSQSRPVGRIPAGGAFRPRALHNIVMVE